MPGDVGARPRPGRPGLPGDRARHLARARRRLPRARPLAAATALALALAPLPAAGQGPRSEPPHALRVGAFFPVSDLADGAVRSSFAPALSFGLVLLPHAGPLARLLVDAGPAVLRVDPDRRQCPLGADCTSETSYGIVLSAAAEAGVRHAIGPGLVAYATLGPAGKLYLFRGHVSCQADDISCPPTIKYTAPAAGPGARASIGVQPPGAGRHLSAEAGALYSGYPGGRAQLDLTANFAFRF